MRRFRKDFIFRLYLAVFSVVSVVSVVFVLKMQARYHRHSVALLESRIVSLESESSRRSAEETKINSVSSSRAEPGDKESLSSEDLYWIEGTGLNRKWWYMDVVFYDGERFRYFLHLPLRRNDLAVFHRRFMHDALFHYRDPVVEDFDIMASDML